MIESDEKALHQNDAATEGPHVLNRLDKPTSKPSLTENLSPSKARERLASLLGRLLARRWLKSRSSPEPDDERGAATAS
jgi:hypothetical protein